MCTAEDVCHDFIQDTVEEQQTWISKMMQKGLCTCDKEHMFTCPDTEGEQQQQQLPQKQQRDDDNVTTPPVVIKTFWTAPLEGPKATPTGVLIFLLRKYIAFGMGNFADSFYSFVYFYTQ